MNRAGSGNQPGVKQTQADRPTGQKRKKRKRNSQGWDVWRRLRQNKKAVVSMLILALLILIVIFAEQIVPYSSAVDMDVPNRFQSPGAEHWFGTDKYGRDVFARVIYGARISLLMGFGATAISAVIGTAIGTSAAYFGGKYDQIITRVLDTWMAIPAMLVTLAVIAGLGVGTTQTIFALAFGGIPGFARTLRGQAMSIVNQDYMEAVKALGASHRRAVFKHVVPNVMSQVLIQVTSGVSGTILMGATLSFLGLGAQPPAAEWGYMLSEGLADYQKYSYLVSIPGLAIAITALAINIFGDALRDALDPRLK